MNFLYNVLTESNKGGVTHSYLMASFPGENTAGEFAQRMAEELCKSNRSTVTSVKVQRSDGQDLEEYKITKSRRSKK